MQGVVKPFGTDKATHIARSTYCSLSSFGGTPYCQAEEIPHALPSNPTRTGLRLSIYSERSHWPTVLNGLPTHRYSICKTTSLRFSKLQRPNARLHTPRTAASLAPWQNQKAEESRPHRKYSSCSDRSLRCCESCIDLQSLLS